MKMHKTILILLAALLVAGVLAGATPAESPLTAAAAEAVVARVFTAEDPGAVYESLTPTEREGFRKFTTTTVVYENGSDEDDVQANTSGCDTNTKYAHRKNLYGMNGNCSEFMRPLDAYTASVIPAKAGIQRGGDVRLINPEH